MDACIYDTRDNRDLVFFSIFLGMCLCAKDYICSAECFYLFNILNFRFYLRVVGRETRTCQYEWVSVVGPMFGWDQAGILLLWWIHSSYAVYTMSSQPRLEPRAHVRPV